MSSVLGMVRSNSAYAFIAVGVVWLAVAVIGSSALILWPVLACLLGGVQLWMWPTRKLTWAWAVSTAIFGFLLAAYQIYAWFPFLGGSFSSVAATASGAFAVIALLHLILLYAGIAPPKSESP